MAGQVTRRRFLEGVGMGAAALALPEMGRSLARAGAQDQTVAMPDEWLHPPHEFSQAPFWFWNDDLSEAELLRQIEDFQAHGVHAFTIHPRGGVPTSIGRMRER